MLLQPKFSYYRLSKMIKISCFYIVLITLIVPNVFGQTVSDADGNSYPIVTIGEQGWMGENLRTTHFENGDPIPTVIEPVDNNPSSIYQWSYDNDTANASEYGRLYSWYAVKDVRNICPFGWKVPALSDWELLAQTLGGDSVAGFALKETDTLHWVESSLLVTNSSGFTGLPAGFRGNSDAYLNLGTTAYFWSTDQFGFDELFKRGYLLNLFAQNGVFSTSVGLGSCGTSVRCMRDESLEKQESEFWLEEVFPNPTDQMVTIRFNQPFSGTLRVVSAEGKVMEEYQFTDKLLLNISQLSSGIYFLRLEREGVLLEKRLIIR